jgi:hypothetical protein
LCCSLPDEICVDALLHCAAKKKPAGMRRIEYLML